MPKVIFNNKTKNVYEKKNKIKIGESSLIIFMIIIFFIYYHFDQKAGVSI